MSDQRPQHDMRRTTMVDTQVRPSDVTKFPIIDALLRIPREAYVPQELASVAYAEAAVPLGQGRELMEARTFAKMLDALDLRRQDLVLIVGGGLGYSAAVIGEMVDAAVMVEEDGPMAASAEATLADRGVFNVAVIAGDLGAGAPKAGPYDVIFIEGAVEMIPDALTEQIADGGRVVAVVNQGALGEVRVGHKSNGRLSWRPIFNATLPLLPGFAKEHGFAL